MTTAAEPLPVEKLYTVEEFFQLVPDGRKADLLDGVIHMASPDSISSDDLGYLVRFLLQGYSRARGLGGKAQGSRVAFVLGERRAPEPDVSFVTRARLSILQQTRGQGPPDIAVEIVSEDSDERDYVTKKRLYEEAGVLEYWILDPLHGRAEFHRLSGGRYWLCPLEDGRVFRSDALPGFRLNTGWLLSSPLPNEFECLRQILAGDPP